MPGAGSRGIRRGTTGRNLEYSDYNAFAMVSPLHTVGTFQTDDTLRALLDRVEAGEEVLITRRGSPAARLVPAQAVLAVGRRATDAAVRIRRRTQGHAAISWMEWKAFRDAGRK